MGLAKYNINKNKGFSLVELMVALVIGLIVLLGASQLFNVGKRTFDQVEALSNRQQSIAFFVDTFSYAVRDASFINIASAEQLKLDFLDREESLYCPGESPHSLTFSESSVDDVSGVFLEVSCAGANQRVLNDIQPGSLDFDFVGGPSGNVGVTVSFTLLDEDDLLEDEAIEFFVVNRAAAIEGVTF